MQVFVWHSTESWTRQTRNTIHNGESAIFTSDPTRAVKCMLQRLCKHYSEASVHSWCFPYQEMQHEARVVTEAYWEGELEGLSTTGAWIFFWWLNCWSRILRHSMLWRCLQRKVSKSRQKMLLMLWRSAVLWWSAT